MIKFSIVIILSVILYLITVLIFYRNIENYLKYRLDFISARDDRRTKIIQLSYFTMEQILIYLSYNSTYAYNYTQSPGILISFEKTNNALMELRTEMESPSISGYIPVQVWNMIYNEMDQYHDFLRYGVLSGIDFYIYESMCMISSSCSNENSNLTAYLDELSELIAALTDIASIAKIDSATQIETQLNSIIYFTSFALLFFVFFYIYFYLPYLAGQCEIVRKIEFMMKITPQNQNLKSKTNNNS
jgi:hypothetical protein